MPRVPVYETPTVQPESLPAARQQMPSGIAQGVAIAGRQADARGQGLMQAGHALDLLQIEQDETDATRAHADFMSATTRVLHGSSDSPGLMQLPGQRAIDAEAGASKLLDDNYNAIRDGLKTQRAQALFTRAATVTRHAASGQIASHVGSAQAQADLDADKRRVDSAGQAAVLAFNPMPGADNSAYQTYLDTRKAALVSLAQRTGVRADQVNEFVQSSMAPIYAGVVAHLADNNQAKAAREYLQSHRDQIADPELQDKLTKLVENASGTEDALSLALALKGSLRDKTRALNDQFKAGTITSKVRDQALQYVEHDARVAKEQEQDGILLVMGKAQQWLIDNPTASALEVPAQWRNVLQMHGHLDSLLQFARNGRYVNDPRTWADIATMTNEELAKMTPKDFELKYRGQLDDQHMLQGVAAVKAARAMPLDGKTLDLVSNSELVKRAARAGAILPASGKPSETQVGMFERFETEVQRRLNQLSTELKGTRAPNQKELQNITDAVLKDHVFVENTFFDDERIAATLTAEEGARAYIRTSGKNGPVKVRDIPRLESERIERYLISQGKPVNQTAIAEEWDKAGRPK